MKRLIIHPRAAKDAREIAAKYDAVSRELYDQFWEELDDAIDHIEVYPERRAVPVRALPVPSGSGCSGRSAGGSREADRLPAGGFPSLGSFRAAVACNSLTSAGSLFIVFTVSDFHAGDSIWTVPMLGAYKAQMATPRNPSD